MLGSAAHHVRRYGPSGHLTRPTEKFAQKKCLETEGRRLPPPISRRQWPDTGRPMPPARPFDILVDCCGGEMPKEFVRVVEFSRQAHIFCDFNRKFALA